jgi:hypothetical protein
LREPFSEGATVFLIAGCRASIGNKLPSRKKMHRNGDNIPPPGYELVTLTPELLENIRFRPITTKTTTRKQKITVPKKPSRDEGIR